ncbi:MAG TPA: cytochrome c biogenesis protein DipZ [bacterium]|nr:cytochrome c biogenesis protein DipZ [bacterium]
MIEILLAFTAGILTIAAPCIFLPLPIIFGASVGQKNNIRPLFITMGFVITFSVLALTLHVVVQSLQLNPQVLRNGAAVLLVIFGIFMIWPEIFERLTLHFSGLINKAGEESGKIGAGNVGGFMLGVLIGVIWAPCAGPILGSILTLISQQADLSKVSFLLIAYALGAGVPMLIIAYGGQVLSTKIRIIAQYAKTLQKIFGIIIIAVAIAVYFQYDTVIQAKILNYFEQSDMMTAVTEDMTQKNLDSIQFKNYGPAPDFIGINHWLNSEPLSIADLKGKVVLVDFWTYSCINCIRTLPYITQWHETYKDKGLVIIGIHTPEFPFEKDTKNVQKALDQFKITYPVAQDNNYQTWRAYHNQYWPAKYLIDRNGNIVYTHFGEGDYKETESAIQTLLGMKASETVSEKIPETGVGPVGSPEMYFGSSRLANLTPDQEFSTSVKQFSFPKSIALHNFALEGKWQFDQEKITLSSNTGKIKLHFSAAKVFMVASQPTGEAILKVRIDGKIKKEVEVTTSTLYTLFDSSEYGDKTIEIEIIGAGFEAFTFTFG